MHALSYHVPVFIKNHKAFKQFTGQGVEKNNDDPKNVSHYVMINIYGGCVTDACRLTFQ